MSDGIFSFFSGVSGYVVFLGDWLAVAEGGVVVGCGVSGGSEDGSTRAQRMGTRMVGGGPQQLAGERKKGFSSNRNKRDLLLLFSLIIGKLFWW
jgi:hypothetical protein